MSAEYETKQLGRFSEAVEDDAFNNFELNLIMNSLAALEQKQIPNKLANAGDNLKPDARPKVEANHIELKPDANLLAALKPDNTTAEEDVFELGSGHKITGSKGFYRITDREGNLIRINPNGLEAPGKVVSHTKDPFVLIPFHRNETLVTQIRKSINLAIDVLSLCAGIFVL